MPETRQKFHLFFCTLRKPNPKAFLFNDSVGQCHSFCILFFLSFILYSTFIQYYFRTVSPAVVEARFIYGYTRIFIAVAQSMGCRDRIRTRAHDRLTTPHPHPLLSYVAPYFAKPNPTWLPHNLLARYTFFFYCEPIFLTPGRAYIHYSTHDFFD